MNSDHPIPDPSWDYAAIWQEIHLAKDQLEDLLTAMAEIENATPESDRLTRRSLEAAQNRILSAIALLK